MRKFWPYSTKVLVVLLVIALWHIYEHHKAYEELSIKNAQLEQALLEANELLVKTEEEREQLEKKTLKGILQETNETVVDSWERLLDKMQEELKKARETLNDSEEDASSETDEGNNEEGTAPPGEQT